MKNSIIAVLLLPIWTSAFLEAGENPCRKERERVVFFQGFAKGSTYLEMTASQKSAYAMGAIDAMLVAPAFGAPEECTKWLNDFTHGMTDQQVAAIITKYLKDNPECWHEQLNLLVYNAMYGAYIKQHPDEK